MIDLSKFPPIPGAIGPGSQPEDEDGGTLEYMKMPEEMAVFRAPELPEPEDMADLGAGLAIGERLLLALQGYASGARGDAIDLMPLDAANRAFVDDLLGEGEVAAIGRDRVQAQESVLAGVWRVRSLDESGALVGDVIEVGAFPSAVVAMAFDQAQDAIAVPESFGEQIFNTPALIAEVNDHIPKIGPDLPTHVINLTLLPHTEQDLTLLDTLLGRDSIIILSRGYGNCRITATKTAQCWWVQFYNSQDALILNTLEITALPEVACASAEDIADSAERLDEILGAYR
ncbi:MAG: hydrogenase expression/formation protein [Neomegalonema sp.]|nr:hydrogenase expression/formation protein [Neomegalonema sp.]